MGVMSKKSFLISVAFVVCLTGCDGVSEEGPDARESQPVRQTTSATEIKKVFFVMTPIGTSERLVAFRLGISLDLCIYYSIHRVQPQYPAGYYRPERVYGRDRDETNKEEAHP